MANSILASVLSTKLIFYLVYLGQIYSVLTVEVTPWFK